MKRLHESTIVFLVALALAGPAAAQVKNGFDLGDALILPGEIHAGGPPRDGIPALTDPVRERAKEANQWLGDEDPVMGVMFGGEAVAYPIRILNWHEVVNDVVGDRFLAVTYCPLCGTGVVFEAMTEERMLFGVSGLLYKSDVLLYDRRTESLFSQLMMKAVSGPLKGTELKAIPSLTTTWEAWKKRYPGTMVASRVTGHSRDYRVDPYRKYHRSSQPMSQVPGADCSHGPKQWAWLVLAEEKSFVVAEEVLVELAGDKAGVFQVDGGVVLRFNPARRELIVETITRKRGVAIAMNAIDLGAGRRGSVSAGLSRRGDRWWVGVTGQGVWFIRPLGPSDASVPGCG